MKAKLLKRQKAAALRLGNLIKLNAPVEIIRNEKLLLRKIDMQLIEGKANESQN
jgi:hypothetical protein